MQGSRAIAPPAVSGSNNKYIPPGEVLMLAIVFSTLMICNADPVPSPDQVRFFEEKIRPVLVEQ